MIEQDIERIQSIGLGAPVTNICAGELGGHGYFMEYKVKTYENKWGVIHRDRSARCKFNGKIGDYGLEIIYPDHLDDDICKELFKPVWEAKFGKK